jgi:microcystin-dependent protein
MSVFKITDIKHPAYADTSILLFGDGTVSIPGLLLDEHELGDLGNVDEGSGVSGGDVLTFNGSTETWVPAPLPPSVPTGAINMFGGGTVPTGWLNCDGAAVSRATYGDLFAVIGTNYGVGDGATTFNLPDLRLRFPRGVGSGLGLGSTANANTHDHTVSEEHSHILTTTVTSGNHAHNHGSGNYSGNAVAVGDHRHSTNTNQTGGGTSGTPNLFQGVGGATNIGPFVGSGNHTHSTPNHNHTINEGENGGHGHNTNVSGNSGSASSATHNHNATANADTHIQNTTSSSSEHVPAYVAVNYIIKT